MLAGIIFYRAIVRSNRTFMELKSLDAVVMNMRVDCSNRTFMELKYHKLIIVNTIISSSNRTFMELKLIIGNLKTTRTVF